MTTLVLSALALGPAATAHQADTVLVAPAPRGLLDALRIHLPHDVSLVVAEASIESERDLAAARRSARIALWLEEQAPLGGERVALLHIASAAGLSRARVSAEGDEQIHRAVALKVREAYDAIAEAPLPLAAPLGHRSLPADPAPKTDDDPLHAGAMLEIALRGFTLSGSVGPQLSLVPALGLSLRQRSWLLELYAFAGPATPLDSRRSHGAVRISEIDFGGGARAAWRQRPLALGGYLELGGRMIDADGVTAAGTHGSADTTMANVMVGAELRAPVVGWLELRGAAGVDIPLWRQRFTLNSQTTLDVGGARAIAQLGLVATLP